MPSCVPPFTAGWHYLWEKRSSQLSEHHPAPLLPIGRTEWELRSVPTAITPRDTRPPNSPYARNVDPWAVVVVVVGGGAGTPQHAQPPRAALQLPYAHRPQCPGIAPSSIHSRVVSARPMWQLCGAVHRPAG